MNLLAARGCSGKLKRLREHEVNYQQELQARQGCDPNNRVKLNGIVASADDRVVEATSKVSAAAAEIIHCAPTMGQGFLTPTSPLLETASVCGLPGSSHDPSSYQIMRYLAQQSTTLLYPNTNMLPPLFASHFDLGSTPQDMSLWRLMQQQNLLARAALFPSLTHQTPTSVFAKAFQDNAGTNYHLNNNTGLSLYQQTHAALLDSTIPSNIFHSAAATASASLVVIAPSGIEAAQANITGNLHLISAGLGLSSNPSILTASNINAHLITAEEQERNAHDYDIEEPPSKGSK